MEYEKKTEEYVRPRKRDESESLSGGG